MWKWIIILGFAYVVARSGPNDPTATAPVGPSDKEIDDLYQLTFASDRAAIAAATGLDKLTLAAAVAAANTVNVPIGWLYALAQQGMPAVQLDLAAHILNNVVHTQPLPVDTQPGTLAQYRTATLAKAQSIMSRAIDHAQLHGYVIEFS